MKNINLISVAITISVIFYIAGSVSSANFNILQWSDSAREMVSIFWAMAMMFTLAVFSQSGGSKS